MSNFLCLFRGGFEDYNKLTQEEKEALNDDWKKWLEELKEQGKLVDGLPLSQDGKVVSAKGGVITNGPFAEGAELVGGYTIISAQDIEEALQLSINNPHFNFAEGTMEVREIVSLEVQ
ncbi:hypothetical protein FVB32_04080 [Flagellimonas hymeniacidonis]|uniref:YCII-related domain-containing protein n=1 Tax=Flagellimonas hymeniacidonis TaxID=2603628 RepID=A0A5C8V5X3_9FLAO|nr:YciI family protein [Flagellimonas hymeniacidonis]TXN37474.1 hypothetical protein FVB32_04080 [Flagellimonas hymeniacidonis]